MHRVCISLLAGAFARGLSPSLPDWKAAAAATVVGGVCLRHRRLWLVAAFLAGYLLLWLASTQVIGDRLAPWQLGHTLTESLQIVDFVEVNGNSARFIPAVIDNDALPSKVRLSWTIAQRIPAIGEVRDLQIRLRPPRGLSNPYGFD